MKSYSFIMMFAMSVMACHSGNNGEAQTAALADSVVTEAPAPELPLLTGDSVMNQAARFYAGISCEGTALSSTAMTQWKGYAQKMEEAMTASRRTTDPMDTLMCHDMTDLRQKCNYVMYPFSGPDFVYPITLFPNADYFFLIGLEPTGTPLTEIVADTKHYQLYTGALNIFMHSSFFRTKSMNNDLDNQTIDGTVPVITMLMALKGYEVIDVTYKQWNEDGTMANASGNSNLVEIHFFNPETPRHLQTLYYLSDNVNDAHFDERISKYMANTLPNHYTVTFLKAASYLLHQRDFVKMRNNLVQYSDALIGDDSGMPYRYLRDDFDVTLYGKYQRPISLFGPHNFQKDLDSLYNQVEVHPLPFRIGYNRISNWMAARKRR